MAIDLAQEPQPIDPNDPKYRTMLGNLQGNILKGHGRDFTVHIFIEFGPDIERVRQGLIRVAERFVTSALQQNIETLQFKSFKIPGGIFGNLLLTAKGYRALGFTDANMNASFPEPDNHFKEGMRAHGADFGDPDPATWQEGYREGRIDAMILLADDGEAFLLREAGALLKELKTHSTVLTVERGAALRTDEGEGIEHFGYVDGRSQPIFFAPDLGGEGEIDQWNPGEPIGLVLVPDAAIADEDCFGSYFVFRKLEQDVLRFTVREQTLAEELGLAGADRERAGAMAVGRFRDGTPLAKSQTDGFLPTKENNFTYAGDVEGLKCPFHAHIRKTNPRGDIVREFGAPESAERSRRIARRGIPYGDRKRHPNAFQALEDLPSSDVGLLFMCFQADIANQFSFMQQTWVNNVDFVRPATGPDPLIAQTEVVAQHWPLQWDQPATRDASFQGFVTLKGGEFFFAPSIPFLRVLAPPGP